MNTTTFEKCPTIDSLRTQVNTILAGKLKPEANITTLVSEICKTHFIQLKVEEGDRPSLSLVKQGSDASQSNRDEKNIELLGDGIGRELQILSLNDAMEVRRVCKLVKQLLKKSFPTIRFEEFFDPTNKRAHWSFSEELRARIASFDSDKPGPARLVPYAINLEEIKVCGNSYLYLDSIKMTLLSVFGNVYILMNKKR